MAIKNSLAKTQNQANNGMIKYDANGETVQLSPNMIKSYLVNGNGAVTDQEVTMFLSLCRFQHLNPFLKEAYLIKYGTSPATVVVGKDVLLKRAMRSEKFGGLSAGVIVVNTNGEIEEREGTFVLPDENLVGGWAKVIIKGYDVPFYNSVSMKEYSTGKSNWLSKPATMIRKVAMAQALREAFPEEMSALYEQEEIREVSDIQLDTTPIAAPVENVVKAPSEPSEPVKVNEPVQEVATPVQTTPGGQTGIDDILYPPVLSGDPPFEV